MKRTYVDPARISWPPELNDKMSALMETLRGMGSALVAYSAGVDSTFLAAVTHSILGEKVVAATAVSPSFPERELGEAVEMARKMGINHLTVQTKEMDNPNYVRNSADRCYHCKKELFSLLKRLAGQRKIEHVLDGTNADDPGDYRPGRKALEELRIESPLMELGFSKADIRVASRLMKLPTATKPAMACLASRIPYGTRITAEHLAMIERAEEGLKGLGLEHLRVRAHGDLARIELPLEDLAMAASRDLREEIVETVKEAGFRYVTLDLQGYRMGSLNEGLA